VPAITFRILDTIDLCPGDCGAVTEQDATIPMSRFEATGLSGDVPFFVEFPAPAAARSGFDVPISTPHPAKPKGGHKKASLDLPSSSADALAAATSAESESATGDELVMADDAEVAPAEEGEVTV
jgi:hypothetical protein